MALVKIHATTLCEGVPGVKSVFYLFIFYQINFHKYSKTCLKRPLKNRQNKALIVNGSFMKVESFSECSLWSILQYF